MKRKQTLCVASVLAGLAAWLLAAVPASAQSAQDALQLVPDKAAGFVIVRSLSDLNSNIETLARRIGQPLPFSPLEKLKSEVGINKGLNASGSLMVVLLPSPQGLDAPPVPLVYVPVTDYQEFLRGLKGQPQGNIAKVWLHNGTKEMVAGKKGSFAVITEPDFRGVLKEALQGATLPREALAPLQSRVTANDVTGVITSHGIKIMAEKAQQGLAQGVNPGQAPPGAEFLTVWAKAFETFLKSAESNVSHLVLGSRLDKAGDLDINAAALFHKGSSFAQAGAKAQSAKGGQLAGLPNEPFLVAFSGSISGKLMEKMMSFGMQMMSMMAKDVPAEKLNKLENEAKQIFKDLRSMSMVMGVGTNGDSLLHNTTAVMKVNDAEAYLKHYVAYLEAYNDFAKGLNAPAGFPVQAMTSKRIMIDGLPALEVVAELGLGANQPDTLRKLMDLYLGPGGKMDVTTVALDKNTLLMRYTSPADTKQFLATYKNQGGGLSQNPGVVKTIELLPPGSQWLFLISPRGTLTIANRVLASVAPPGAGPGRLPEFAKTPPIGVAVKLSPEGLDNHLEVPAAVIDNIGPFIQQIVAQKRAARSAN